MTRSATTAGLSPSPITTRSQAVHNNVTNNAEESEPTVIRRSTRRAALDAKARITEETKRELERKRRSTSDLKPAHPPLHQSTVSLKAAPGKGAGTIATTEALKHRAAMNDMEDKYEPQAKKVKNDLEEVEEKIEEVKENIEEVKENVEVVTSRIATASAKLTAVQAKYNMNTAHTTAEPLFQQMAKDASTKIGPNDLAAPEMQRLTNTTLEKSDVIAISKRLNKTGSDGTFAYYKHGTETVQSKEGKTVLLNPHIVGKAIYEHNTEKNMGLAGINKALSRNLIQMIVENAAAFPHILKCGKDYFSIVEEPESWHEE